MDVPFPLVGATVLADQLQLDPVDVVEALVRELRRHGGVLHQGLRATRATRGATIEVGLSDDNTLTCENLVLATGVPILDRGLFFAKVEPERSYGLAFRGVASPAAMFLSVGSSTRSVRDVPSSEGAVLLVGGAGHVVGRTSSETEHLEELRAWTGEHFPGAVETHAWSAQDYASYDGLPHVGRLPRGGGHIFAATGFGKWGMTNGVAAGLAIAGRILGSAPAWAKPLERSFAPPRGVAEIARINLGVGWAQARALAGAELRSTPAQPPESGGVLGRRKGLPVGVAEVQGRPCRVLGVCTHLGGTLHWNDAERSWDCPLHGSRFAADGAVLEGPATRALKRLD
jgi:nitrite reductase/ring-hydroxylating ferredoxin subunit